MDTITDGQGRTLYVSANGIGTYTYTIKDGSNNAVWEYTPVATDRADADADALNQASWFSLV